MACASWHGRSSRTKLSIAAVGLFRMALGEHKSCQSQGRGSLRTAQGPFAPAPEGHAEDFHALAETGWVPANSSSAPGRTAQAPPSGEPRQGALLPSWVWQGRAGQDPHGSTPLLSSPQLSSNPHHNSVGAPDFHFCYRLSDRKGMSQGHAEPGLEPRVLSFYPIWLHSETVLGFSQLAICLHGHTAWPFPA